MFNKIVICLIFFLINSTLEYTPTYFEKYGKKTVSDITVFYLSLEGFKSGDTLYFEGSYTGTLYTEIPLYFKETDVLEYYSPNEFTQVFSNSYSQVGAHATYYISYTLKGNNKYLLIITPNFDTPVTFTLEHTKGNNIIWLIIAVVAVFVIAIIIFIVVCRLRRKSAMM